MSRFAEQAPMTAQQRELARSALGLTYSRRSYRNRFLAGGGDVRDAWQDLVAKGLATTAPADGPTSRSAWFFLTQAGAEAALNRGESLCAEDWPDSPRKSRAQARRRAAALAERHAT